MSHSECVRNDVSTYLDDSDEESLFFVPRLPTTTLPFSKHPINKRIIQSTAPWQKTEKQAYVSFLKHHFDLMDRPSQ